MAIISINGEFSLRKIEESGQCFRWTELSEGSFLIQSGNRLLTIRPGGEQNRYEVSCSIPEWNSFWHHYFDLDTDYAAIRSMIDRRKDPYLFKAAEAGREIRILNQDPWETLISFIISQRKSIPAIRTCIEKLCIAAGKQLEESTNGTAYYAFPSPEALASLDEERLSECGLGYRTRYIAATTNLIASGTVSLEEMQNLNDEEQLSVLMKLPGVGIKVASCVQLFGFHRLNAFPKDVWINRTLQEHYPEGFPYRQYDPYSGVMQQYLFYYRRREEKE